MTADPLASVLTSVVDRIKEVEKQRIPITSSSMTWKRSPLKISNEEKFRIISLPQQRVDMPTEEWKGSSDHHSENELQRITRSLFDDDNDHGGDDQDVRHDDLDYDSSQEYMNDWKIDIDGITLESPEVQPPPPARNKFDDANVDQLILSISKRHILVPSLSEFHDFLSSIEKSFPSAPQENQIPVKSMRNETLVAYLRTKVS
jgi:hypothetical protein